MAGRVSGRKAQRTMHAAGFVAVHATRHEQGGQAVDPATAAQGHQGERLAVISLHRAHLAVGLHVPLVSQCVDRRQHISRVAALAHLPRAPLCHLGRAPGLARSANGMVKNRVAGTGRHGVLCVGQTHMMPLGRVG